MHATTAPGPGAHSWKGLWHRFNSSSTALAVAAGVAALALLSSFYQVVDGAVERAALKRVHDAQAVACRSTGPAPAQACDPDLVLARLP